MDQQKPSSLLSDWKSYTASRDSEETSSGSSSTLGFDIESAVRTANDKFTGTFNVVSKGVRDLPGNLQSATSNIPSGKFLMYFGVLLATGVFFIFISFTMFLPIMVLMPQKFAICFTLGCIFIIGSFFALKGPQNQFTDMTSEERLPFTVGFIGSMLGTLYVSMVLHSYILSVLFSVVQVFNSQFFPFSLINKDAFKIIRKRVIISNDMTLRTAYANKATAESGQSTKTKTLPAYNCSAEKPYSNSQILSNSIKVLALSYYTISYFPGGSTGMKFLSSTLISSIAKCFGR
ncbi:hypothetical protein GIB67_001075 [Kingdonia uniflora]|uniref:Vesicle transport protein n=1 Tax=Kingdonia uniflora TaxID=39325 RepID=A0A7J7MGA0_9MAGN|nr:hypothetical protein GIB67_001075 [Kingdonia uniflora]